MKRNAWIGTAVAVVLVGGGAAFFLRNGKEEIKWRTAKVDKGKIVARISATGTLNALIQVPVGTQVSGVVTHLFADYNSLVKKGQVLGTIDETPWLADLRDSQAALQRAKDTLTFAQADYKRNQRLFEEKLVDQADLETKRLALQVAQGNVASSTAQLDRAKLNLSYCTLRAPVDGVVVARLVDVGQTVAASFSTPNMFTITQDLAKMKVQAAIDEADIGQVRVGQKAFFTVDSYPDKQFRGLVSEVQLNPIITQNVVTYNVVMEVDNEPRYALASAGAAGGKADGKVRMDSGKSDPGPGRMQGAAAAPAGPVPRGQGRHEGRGGRPAEPLQTAQIPDLEMTTARYIPPGSPIYKGNLALFPGMTANCTVITTEKDQVLRVPSSALRFNPAIFTKDLETKPGQGSGVGQAQAQGASRPAGGGGANAGGVGKGLVAKRDDRVWTLAAGKPKAIPVKVGVTDGMFTEVSGEGIAEGLVILTGVEDVKKLNTGAAPIAGPGGPGGMRR